MENATKALLIAAAVLIVIVLVALGIKLLGTTGNTDESAKIAGNSIGQQTHDLSSDIQVDLIDTSKMSDLEFSKFIYNNYAYEKVGEVSGKQVLKMCKLIREKYGELRVGEGNDYKAHISWDNGSNYGYKKIEDTVKNNLSGKYTVNKAGGGSWEGTAAYLSIVVRVSE